MNRFSRAAVVALTVLAGFVFVATAQACGEVTHSSAHSGPRHGRAPLTIGDSTLIYAAPILGRMGIEADAHGCRQFAQGIQILAARKRAGTLPSMVIVALGANGVIAPGQIGQVLGLLGAQRTLLLVTPRNLSVSAARMRQAAALHPDRILLVDWARYSAGHGAWFDGDSLHPNMTGAHAYAALIRGKAAPFAFPPVTRLRLTRHIARTKACGSVHRGHGLLRVYIARGASTAQCSGARRVVSRFPLQPMMNWAAYDWRNTRAGPWDWVYRRRDGHVVITAISL